VRERPQHTIPTAFKQGCYPHDAGMPGKFMLLKLHFNRRLLQIFYADPLFYPSLQRALMLSKANMAPPQSAVANRLAALLRLQFQESNSSPGPALAAGDRPHAMLAAHGRPAITGNLLSLTRQPTLSHLRDPSRSDQLLQAQLWCSLLAPSSVRT
jgi:hypothetical protein